MMRNFFRTKVYPWMLRHNSWYEEIVAGKKKKIFSQIEGKILEIGPGTGANFRFYPKNISWTGLEPNEAMHEFLREEAAINGIRDITIVQREAEKFPFEENSFDAVVSTLVLCSVRNQHETLKEIFRVLKPRGKFFFG